MSEAKKIETQEVEETVEAVSAEEKVYTEEDIKNQIKPLSENAFLRFFQKIWRGYLSEAGGSAHGKNDGCAVYPFFRHEHDR